MESVYVVECANGAYDDYCWWIAGIFDSREKAQQAADNKNA